MSELAQAKTVSRNAEESIAAVEVARIVALALAGAWAGYFLFTGMPQLTLQVFPRTIVLHAMLGGLALVYLLYLVSARRLPGGTPLDAGVLAVAGVYAIATFTSVNWRASLEWTLLLGAGLVAFYALADLPLLSAERLRRALALAGGALALYALWVVGNDYADYLSLVRRVEGLDAGNIFPPTVPRVHDVSDHPNVLAMILTLVLPLFALDVYAPAHRMARVFGAAGLAVGGMAIFLTLSRSGWLGAATGVSLTVVGCWLTARLWERERRGEQTTWRTVLPQGFSPTALAAVGGALVLAAGGTLAFLSNSSTRPGWLFRGSLSPREDAWRAGLEIFRDHPLFGAGPDAFAFLYPSHADGNFLLHTQHAHNGFLQAATDAGVAGLLALAALAAAAGYMLYQTWTRGELQQRLLAVTVASALIGFGVHNLFDAGNTWKAPLIALAVVGAIIVRNYRESMTAEDLTSREVRRLRVPSLAARGALLALLFVPFAGWYRIDAAHHDYYVGMSRLNQGESDAIGPLQEAVNADSSMMVYQMQLGIAQAMMYQSQRDAPQPLIDGAVIHLERAVNLDERSDIAHANLAIAYELAGRDDEAAAEAQKARYIARYHVPPVLAAAEVYERIGRADEAIDTYAQAISMDAGLADSNFWEGSAFRREHLDEILTRSTLGINPCTRGAYLAQAHRHDPSIALDGLDEDASGCKFLVFTSFPDDLVLRVNLARILMAQEAWDEAYTHLDYAVRRQPDFGPARTELGRWYAAQGDIEAARQQWVRGADLDEGESVLLLGESYPADERPAELTDRLEELARTSGSSVRNDVLSVLYYRLRYGRISPYFPIIPGDWFDAVPRQYEEMQSALARWTGDAEAN